MPKRSRFRIEMVHCAAFRHLAFSHSQRNQAKTFQRRIRRGGILALGRFQRNLERNGICHDRTARMGTTAAGGSALQILVGYNIEISFMFFILGMLTCKLLKTTEGYEGQGFFDANKNWLDDPNNMYYKANKKKSELTPEEYKTKVKAILGRIGVIVFGSIAAVIIEILLNKCNVLTWEKPWWQPNFPFILFLIGYVPFYVAAVVIHDLPRKWQLIGLGAILFVVVLLLIISGSLGMLGHQTDGHGNWIGKFCDGDNGIIRAILRV